MTKRKIIIATTFRDFIGNDNDKNQYLFLESLQAQTHSDWELAVTIFNEKNVEKTLKKLGIAHKIYKDRQNHEHRYSHSDVFLNGIKSIHKPGSIYLWTTSDVIYEPDFLALLAKHCRPGMAGTSHPHLIASGIDNHEVGKYEHAPLFEGFDLLFYDGDLFLDKKNLKLIKDYYFSEWGIFEHFLIGIAQVIANKRINIWTKSKVRKILNDREASNDTSEFMDRSWKRNYEVLQKFIADNNLDDRLIDLYYCHRQFKIPAKLSYHRQYGKERLGRDLANSRRSVGTRITKLRSSIKSKIQKG